MTQYIGAVPESAKQEVIRVDQRIFQQDDNMVNNGSMILNQRRQSSSSYAGTYTNFSPADSWGFYAGRAGWDLSRDETDVPSYSQVGCTLPASFHIEATTGYGTGAEAAWGMTVEGYHLADWEGDYITISFWVKSNVVGQTLGFGVANAKPVAKRNTYTTTYTVNTADTWERKIIHIPMTYANPTWWNYYMGASMNLNWQLSVAGATQADGSWTAGINTPYSVNSYNVQASAGNYIKFAGVKVEGGRVNDPEFILPSYPDALDRGQRFVKVLVPEELTTYQRLGNGQVKTGAQCEFLLDVGEMAGRPTVESSSDYTTLVCYIRNTTKPFTNSFSWQPGSNGVLTLQASTTTTNTAGDACSLIGNNTAAWWFIIRACGG